ncbi:MAG TPA: pyridoxal-dependent decarboxylase [Thermoanaerobaculia bacterium]|nr:pyridoxal-dependent decarboxylase [Thermoanaerobaculia bacterium]
MSRDLPIPDIRSALHEAAEHVADYLANVERYPVLPPVSPGEVAASLPEAPPRHAETLPDILADYRRLIEPNVTHWNHPGFMAYLANTGSGPGILAELLAASLNVNAMLWRTAPAATELEERACDWLRQMLDLPAAFRGHINDTASTSTFLALAAARDRAAPEGRRLGLTGLSRPLVVYCSDQAHSSVDKAWIALGLGLEQVRRVASDEALRLRPDALEAAIEQDLAAGRQPAAVVATAGTTSTGSLDPIVEVAAIARRLGLWLHVDAAYGGGAAVCAEIRAQMAGMEEADSIVINPHKWLFVPVDCSVLYCRDPGELKRAFSLVPEYLRTADEGATNLMDLGIQLGRRFRALKLWMVIRAFGVEGIIERIRHHLALAQKLAGWVEAEPGFVLAAPVPLSVVAFRAVGLADPEAEDRWNEEILAAVNRRGPVFLSHSKLGGRLVLRVAIGNLRTEEEHVATAWRLVREEAAALRPRFGKEAV